MISQSVEQSNEDQDGDQLSESSQRNRLGSTLSALIWNTYSANQRHWCKDFNELSGDNNLVLLQSVSVQTTDPQLDAVSTISEWAVAVSEQSVDGDALAGVKTGCTVASNKQIQHVLQQSEVDKGSSGVLLETHYALGTSSQTLMVLNMLATDGLPVSQCLEQFEQLCHCIEQHNGPIIVGGCFDSWSTDRLAKFQQYAAKAALFEASMTRQGSVERLTKHLDHVFFRGMSLQSVESMPQMQSTDYSPIIAKFIIQRVG